ncbi:hypothetical protein FRC08_001436 [Ceratobasidium sp. 394]|nr:hypothetical protein FRC08_001436 [Ceratobasidium sp. 394]
MGVTAIENLSDFNNIINSGKPVVIDFWATWCGPCRVISPIFEELSNNIKEVDFYKVDVDSVGDVAQEVGIRVMPTFIAFKDGNKVADVIGANPQGLQKLIRQAQGLPE